MKNNVVYPESWRWKYPWGRGVVRMGHGHNKVLRNRGLWRHRQSWPRERRINQCPKRGHKAWRKEIHVEGRGQRWPPLVPAPRWQEPIFLKSHRNNKKLLEKSQFFLCWRLFRVKLNTFKPTHPSSLSHLSKLALPYIANFPPGTEARYLGVTLGPLSCSISDLVSLNLFNLKLQKRKY